MTTQWHPIGISSIRTPEGEICMHKTTGMSAVSLQVRQAICDAVNAANDRKRKKIRLPTRQQLKKFVSDADQPGASR